MHYLEFLRAAHEQLQPETYLEVGLRNGDSFALSRCTSVGIDPAYNLTAELGGRFSLIRTTSDDFFARPDPLRATDGRPFDLTFIDGLHLFEYSLRDFIHAERHSRHGGVIVFDDVLPRSSDEAARERHTNFWTGDVYKVAVVLARYRPDLVLVTLDTVPTGLMLVMGLNPANTALTDNYAQILAEFRTADPQAVPPEILNRERVLDPGRVLAGSLLTDVRAARSEAARGELEPVLRAAVDEAGRASANAVADVPAPAVPAEVAAALATCQFAADAASIVESADGALLSLPVPGLQLDDPIAGQLRLGPLAVPARLSAAEAGAAIQAWVSGLPGEYPLAIRFADADRDCGVHLLVGPAGELSVVAEPTPEPVAEVAATLPAHQPLRALARRVPGLRPLVRAIRARRATH